MWCLDFRWHKHHPLCPVSNGKSLVKADKLSTIWCKCALLSCIHPSRASGRFSSVAIYGQSSRQCDRVHVIILGSQRSLFHECTRAETLIMVSVKSQTHCNRVVKFHYRGNWISNITSIARDFSSVDYRARIMLKFQKMTKNTSIDHGWRWWCSTSLVQNSSTLIAACGTSYAILGLDFLTPAVNQTLSDL
jgi:hypothetical protein